MIWVDGENLPVDSLRILQTPGLMVLDRERHCFGNRCHGVYYTTGSCRRAQKSRGLKLVPGPTTSKILEDTDSPYFAKSVRKKRGQVPLPGRPEGCFAQRYLTPFFPTKGGHQHPNRRSTKMRLSTATPKCIAGAVGLANPDRRRSGSRQGQGQGQSAGGYLAGGENRPKHRVSGLCPQVRGCLGGLFRFAG